MGKTSGSLLLVASDGLFPHDKCRPLRLITFQIQHRKPAHQRPCAGAPDPKERENAQSAQARGSPLSSGLARCGDKKSVGVQGGKNYRSRGAMGPGGWAEPVWKEAKETSEAVAPGDEKPREALRGERVQELDSLLTDDEEWFELLC